MLTPERVSAQQSGVEELTRGPIHEGFAGSVNFNPEAGILVSSSPPENIEEVPPEQRLKGDNVAWIPGYWAWDGEEKDFIWMSGIWRNLPPGRQWIPGYWAQADDQWQWTSGYWANEDSEEITYLPRPPKSIESGPNVEAPSNNDIWISGNWTRREERYAWTPGYWEPAQSNWSCIPAHYHWTRRGYVFNDGYWDHSVARRGVMFAPVRFQGDYYRRSGYTFTPLLVISLSVLSDHLFVRPNYGHYYFGDYYSPRYRDSGYYASHSYFSARRGYDPIYAHKRWQHREDRDWDRGRIDNFIFYRDHEDARPGRTWAEVQTRSASKNKDGRNQSAIAQLLSIYSGQADSGKRFQSVNQNSRDNYIEEGNKIRKFGKERQKVESQSMEKAAKGADKDNRVSREKFGKSPLAAKKEKQSSGQDNPPERPGPRNSQPEFDDKSAAPNQKADKPGKSDKSDNQRDKGNEQNITPQKKDSPRPDSQADPKKSSKAKPESGRQSEAEPKRQEKPDKTQESKRQSAPAQKQSEQSSEKTSKQKNSKDDPSSDGGKDNKK